MTLSRHGDVAPRRVGVGAHLVGRSTRSTRGRAIEVREHDVELDLQPEPARLGEADADGGRHLRVGRVELVPGATNLIAEWKQAL